MFYVFGLLILAHVWCRGCGVSGIWKPGLVFLMVVMIDFRGGCHLRRRKQPPFAMKKNAYGL